MGSQGEERSSECVTHKKECKKEHVYMYIRDRGQMIIEIA